MSFWPRCPHQVAQLSGQVLERLQAMSTLRALGAIGHQRRLVERGATELAHRTAPGGEIFFRPLHRKRAVLDAERRIANLPGQVGMLKTFLERQALITVPAGEPVTRPAAEIVIRTSTGPEALNRLALLGYTGCTLTTAAP